MSFLKYSFGGLTPSFMLRQYLFALLWFGFIYYTITQAQRDLQPEQWLYFGLSVALFPYARFVYHQITDFLMGNNQFEIPIVIFLIWKFFTFALCFGMAIFIAPVGLIYLYFSNKSAANKAAQIAAQQDQNQEAN